MTYYLDRDTIRRWTSNRMTDRDITITIKLDTGNDDAVDVTTAYYVGKHVKQVGRDIVEGRGHVLINMGGHQNQGSGKIRDENGNTIGEWSIDGSLDS